MRSKVLRRVGAAVAATIAVTTLAANTGQAASKPSAIKRGGTVNVGIFDTFPGWCSNNNPANSSLMATRTVYETLFEKTTRGEMVGLLAASGKPDSTLKVWTVKLRPGIKFHNGTAMTAANVKTGLDIAFAHNLGKAAAIGAIGTAVAFGANIAKIEAPDDLTLKFTLDRPQNDFTGTLYASGRFFVRAPEQFATKSSCTDIPIGTGPFMVEPGYSFANAGTKDKLTVIANPNYWRKDPVTKAKLPYLDKIVFENIKESSQRAAAVKAGRVDAAMFSSAGDATFIQDLRKRKSTLTEYKSPNEYYPSLWLNQGGSGSSAIQSPFKHKPCREAVAYGLDRKTYVKVRTRGEARAADSLVGPSSVMYTKKNFITYNKAKAIAKVAECKALNGGTFSFTIPADTSSVSLNNAKEIQRQMAAVGIEMGIKQEEAAVIIATAFNAGKKNQYQAIPILLFEGTDVSFNLPFVVTNMFTSTSTSPAKALKGVVGDILSLNRHTDTKVDEMFYAGEAAKSAAAAKKKFAAATAYVQAETLQTSILHFYYTMFTNKKLAGVGKLQLVKGKTQRIVTNWGIDWAGVQKKG